MWHSLAQELRFIFEDRTVSHRKEYKWPDPVAQYKGDLGIYLVPDKNNNPVLALRPNDLRAALVLYAARMKATGTTFHICENCKTPFLSGGVRFRNKRGDAKFCSNECRWKYTTNPAARLDRGRMASIRKRKFGSGKEAWVVDYVDQHGNRRLKTISTKKQTEAWRVNALHEVQQGIHTPASISKTVEQAWRLWLADCEANNLEFGTIRQRRQHLNLHVAPYIGRLRLADLATPLVYDFDSKLRNDGRRDTDATFGPKRQLDQRLSTARLAAAHPQRERRPRTFRALLNHFGDARAALDALPALARRGGGGAAPKICSREEAEREIESSRKLGVELVAIGEADYPHRWR